MTDPRKKGMDIQDHEVTPVLKAKLNAMALEFCEHAFRSFELPPERLQNFYAPCIGELLEQAAGAALAEARPAIAAVRAALRETLAEAIEHRDDIIKARQADFMGIANPKMRATYEREIARMDAMIERAHTAMAEKREG